MQTRQSCSSVALILATVLLVAAGSPAGSATVYSIADKVSLRPEPRLGTPIETAPRVAFGQEMVISEERGDWLLVQVSDRGLRGWVHRALVTSSSSLPSNLRAIGIHPVTVLFVSGIQNRNTFQVSVVHGGIRLGTKRLLAEHGTCVVTGDGTRAAQVGGLSMKGFGVEQVIESPQPWTLYFYSSGEKLFRPVASLITDGKLIEQGVPRPREEPVIGAAEQKPVRKWPTTEGDLRGANPVRIKNPREFSAKVALRAGNKGKDFFVPPGDSATVYVPDGRYDIYFQYSDDPEGLYQGEGFVLSRSGVEIQLAKVVGGNYGIRKIK